jgi:hypothetical protein
MPPADNAGVTPKRTRLAAVGAVAVVAVVAVGALAACTGPSRPAPSRPTPTKPTRAPSSSTGPTSSPSGRTVWLCRPGLADNPCTADLTSTAVTHDGTRSLEHVRLAAAPPVDCFYVYPTVSRQPGPNANLHVDPEETAVAIAQASRFSQACRVFAPMYPQLTVSAIGRPAHGAPPAAAITAYLGVLNAWTDYLAHDNHGRGVVFVGHSQGAAVLIALLARVVDPDPVLRRRLVSALLLGGNVTVRKGSDVGGSFRNIPACRTARQTGCVVAYSSFSGVPPANSLFGRVDVGLGAGLSGSTGDRQDQVLCTDPATLDGSRGRLRPYFPTEPFPGLPGSSRSARAITTPWVDFPGEYTARCRESRGASWLQVTPAEPAGEQGPLVRAALGPRWGLHLVDVNIALGNLVDLVRDQIAAYRR